MGLSGLNGRRGISGLLNSAGFTFWAPSAMKPGGLITSSEAGLGGRATREAPGFMSL